MQHKTILKQSIKFVLDINAYRLYKEIYGDVGQRNGVLGCVHF